MFGVFPHPANLFQSITYALTNAGWKGRDFGPLPENGKDAHACAEKGSPGSGCLFCCALPKTYSGVDGLVSTTIDRGWTL